VTATPAAGIPPYFVTDDRERGVTSAEILSLDQGAPLEEYANCSGYISRMNEVVGVPVINERSSEAACTSRPDKVTVFRGTGS